MEWLQQLHLQHLHSDQYNKWTASGLNIFVVFLLAKWRKLHVQCWWSDAEKQQHQSMPKRKKKTQSQKFHRSNLRCCLYRDKYCFAICCFRFHSIIFGHYFPFSHSILVISLVYCCCSMEKCDFTHSECVSILLWKISNEAREWHTKYSIDRGHKKIYIYIHQMNWESISTLKLPFIVNNFVLFIFVSLHWHLHRIPAIIIIINRMVHAGNVKMFFKRK